MALFVGEKNLTIASMDGALSKITLEPFVTTFSFADVGRIVETSGFVTSFTLKLVLIV